MSEPVAGKLVVVKNGRNIILFYKAGRAFVQSAGSF